MVMRATFVILAAVALLLAACGISPRTPDLSGLYSELARQESPERNPIILIPGLLGSKLVEKDSGDVVWGAFDLTCVDPSSAKGARQIALPMQMGVGLSRLQDNLVPAGALDRVIVYLMGYPLAQQAYSQLLSALGIGGYRDEALGRAGAIDWGDDHFTCFQYDYDWRRDIAESAAGLDRFIREKRVYVQQELEKRYGIKNHDVRFDIVAHSMGSLVGRYYLRYGTAPLPEDGSLPPVNWAGAKYVEKFCNDRTAQRRVDRLSGGARKGLRPGACIAVLSPRCCRNDALALSDAAPQPTSGLAGSGGSDCFGSAIPRSLATKWLGACRSEAGQKSATSFA